MRNWIDLLLATNGRDMCPGMDRIRFLVNNVSFFFFFFGFPLAN